MLTIAAFASLAQLGSGLALALAIFVEPIMTRDRRFRDRLTGALRLVPRTGGSAADDRRSEILLKLADLNTSSKLAQRKAKRPLFLIKSGAAINFLILLIATVCPDAEVTQQWTLILLAILILPILTGFCWATGIARLVIVDPNE